MSARYGIVYVHYVCLDKFASLLEHLMSQYLICKHQHSFAFHMFTYVVCVYVCMCSRMYVFTHVCVYVCMCLRMYVFTYVCVYVCMCLHMYVFTYVCVYVCMSLEESHALEPYGHSSY